MLLAVWERKTEMDLVVFVVLNYKPQTRFSSPGEHRLIGSTKRDHTFSFLQAQRMI